MRIIACLAVFSIVAPARSEEVTTTFRGGNFDDNLVRFTGSTPKEFITPDEHGLRLRYSPGKIAKDPAGVFWRFHVRGNFVATAKYQILHVEHPATGFGVGPELYLMLNNPDR